jgi:hypothetical protein
VVKVLRGKGLFLAGQDGGHLLVEVVVGVGSKVALLHNLLGGPWCAVLETGLVALGAGDADVEPGKPELEVTDPDLEELAGRQLGQRIPDGVDNGVG